MFLGEGHDLFDDCGTAVLPILVIRHCRKKLVASMGGADDTHASCADRLGVFERLLEDIQIVIRAFGQPGLILNEHIEVFGSLTKFGQIALDLHLNTDGAEAVAILQISDGIVSQRPRRMAMNNQAGGRYTHSTAGPRIAGWRVVVSGRIVLCQGQRSSLTGCRDTAKQGPDLDKASSCYHRPLLCFSVLVS